MNASDTDTASVHALFQSYDGMEGVAVPAPEMRAAAKWGEWSRAIYPGLLIAGTIALAATWLSQHYNSPVMLFALLFGMTFHFLMRKVDASPASNSRRRRCCGSASPCSARASRRRRSSRSGCRRSSSCWSAWRRRSGSAPGFRAVFGLTRSFGVLSGGAVAICGASAALAIASVLPRHRDSERDTILTVVTVTLMSTAAMILYPLLATALGFDHAHAGVFLGARSTTSRRSWGPAIRSRRRPAMSRHT